MVRYFNIHSNLDIVNDWIVKNLDIVKMWRWQNFHFKAKYQLNSKKSRNSKINYIDQVFYYIQVALYMARLDYLLKSNMTHVSKFLFLNGDIDLKTRYLFYPEIINDDFRNVLKWDQTTNRSGVQMQMSNWLTITLVVFFRNMFRIVAWIVVRIFLN